MSVIGSGLHPCLLLTILFVPSLLLHFYFPPASVLGCPIARKRRLEEAEAEQDQDSDRPASKRKSHPLKLALDEGFSAESDASSEAEGEKEGENGSQGETKEEEEKDTAVEEEREEVTEDLAQEGQTNGQEEETRSQQKDEEEEREEEEETYQKDKTSAAGEGRFFSVNRSHLCLFFSGDECC